VFLYAGFYCIENHSNGEQKFARVLEWIFITRTDWWIPGKTNLFMMTFTVKQTIFFDSAKVAYNVWNKILMS